METPVTEQPAPVVEPPEPVIAASEPAAEPTTQPVPEQQQEQQQQQASLDAALNISSKLGGSQSNLAQPTKQQIPAEAFASAKQSIQESKIYDHLSNVILKILQLKPSNAYRDFELVSQLVKKEQSVVPDAGSQADIGNGEERKFTDLFISTVKDPRVVAAEIPDLLSLSELFSQAGINVTQEETYRVLVGMKKLEEAFECKSVRFFGKIFGSKSNYYIIESERSTSDEVPLVGDVQAEQGVGANKYIYFVSPNGLNGWKKLPDAQPAFIQKSRKIRKLLTGNLDAPIKSQPNFEGTEADYLRSLIARISATTVISPNGYYKFDEDEEGVVVLNTDFEWPNPDSLLALDNWVHHIPYLLPQGRTTYVKPIVPASNADGEANQQQDEEEEDGDDDKKESGPPLLSPLSEDRPLKHDIPCWSVRPAFQHVQLKHSAIAVRNNLWPGAVTIGFNDKFANFYAGWGVKDLGDLYIPEDCQLEQQEFKAATAEEEPKEQEESDPPAEEKPEGDDAAADEDEDQDEP